MDTVALPLSRFLGRLLHRPSEDQLHTMAGRVSALDPTSASPALAAAGHIQAGRAALERGAMGEALHHFGQAIERYPEARWAWHGRGDALQFSGDHAGAEAAYGQAVDLDPECGLHHGGRANALAAQGQAEAAEEAWELALRLDPTLEWMRPG